MSDSVQNNSSPAPEFDPYYSQEGDDSGVEDPQENQVSLGEGSDTNFYGDMKSNVSKDDIRKLYQGIDAKNPSNETELLSTLREALKDFSSSNESNKAKADQLYYQVEEKFSQMTNNSSGPDGNNTGADGGSGDTTTVSSNEADPSQKENSEPSAVNPNFDDSIPTVIKGKMASYTKEGDIQLHPNYDSNTIENYDISADTVTLQAINRNDKFTVTFDDSKNKYVVNAEGKDQKGKVVSNTFTIDATKTITFSMPSDKLDTSSLPGDKLTKIKVLNSEGKPVMPGWPTLQELSNKIAHTDDSAGETRDALSKLDAGMKNGDFGDFSGYLGSLSAGLANDVVRKITTGIFKFAGSDETKFKNLLMILPEDVRQLMYERVSWTGGEWGDYKNGELDNDHGKRGEELWDNRQTAEKIAETLTPGSYNPLPKKEKDD